METALYFAYGSNLDQTQMLARCPSSIAIGPACLAHHRLDFTYYSSRWSGGAADVLPHSQGRVWGMVYELAGRDLLGLDRFEVGYDRIFLEVASSGGVAQRVQTYAVRHKRSFRPSPRYLDQILRWARHWGLPAEYIASIARSAGAEAQPQ